jgi:hypothetical protein
MGIETSANLGRYTLSLNAYQFITFDKKKIPLYLEYSNFSQKMEKMKSPRSMRNGRFHMEVLYTHSPKMLGPFPNFFITPKKLKKKEGDRGTARRLIDCGLWSPASPGRVP